MIWELVKKKMDEGLNESVVNESVFECWMVLLATAMEVQYILIWSHCFDGMETQTRLSLAVRE